MVPGLVTKGCVIRLSPQKHGLICSKVHGGILQCTVVAEVVKSIYQFRSPLIAQGLYCSL